jgi:hypothetical protein
MDRGHREVVLVVDWSGLPEFAPFVLDVYLYQLILDELVYNQGWFEKILPVYEFKARIEMERLLCTTQTLLGTS